MNKKLFLLLILCCSFLYLVGCSSINKKLEGTWKYEWTTIHGDSCKEQYIFKTNGTGTYTFHNWNVPDRFNVYGFKYTIEDNLITITKTASSGDTSKEEITTYIRIEDEDEFRLIDLCSDKSCDNELTKE